MEDVDKVGQQLAAALQNGDVENTKRYVKILMKAKVPCAVSVDFENLKDPGKEQDVSINIHIEDRNQSGDLILSLKVKLSDTVGQLKRKMLLKYKFPMEIQKWIINKRVGSNNETLKRLGVKEGDTVYLYLMSAKSVGLSKEEFDKMLEQLILNPEVAPPTPDTPMSAASMRVFPPSRQRSTQSLNSDRSSLGQLQLSEELRSSEGQSLSGLMSRNALPPPDVYEPVYDPSVDTPTPSEGGKWSCPDCTYLNPQCRMDCCMCHYQRPDTYQIPALEQRDPTPDTDREVNEAMDSGTLVMSLPMTGLKTNLLVLLTRKTPDRDIISWMKMAYTPAMIRSDGFIRMVVTCVCQRAITKIGTVYYVDQHQISIRASLLKMTVNNQEYRQVAALYAIQAIYHTLGYPEGILPRLLEAMFNEGIISLMAFRIWERSLDEPEGKTRALYDAQSFLNDLHTDADIEFD